MNGARYSDGSASVILNCMSFVEMHMYVANTCLHK